MKVILYMAISANGMIAKSNDDTSWISKEEWVSYSAAIRTAGCLIVGHRTYNILSKQPEFSELKDVKLVVVSRKDVEVISQDHAVARSPQEALEILKDFATVMVAGGGLLNSSFLKKNLIDEIYLDIEPIILEDGIKLFEKNNVSLNLELLGTKAISKNEIQLYYKVIK